MNSGTEYFVDLNHNLFWKSEVVHTTMSLSRLNELRLIPTVEILRMLQNVTNKA